MHSSFYVIADRYRFWATTGIGRERRGNGESRPFARQDGQEVVQRGAAHRRRGLGRVRPDMRRLRCGAAPSAYWLRPMAASSSPMTWPAWSTASRPSAIDAGVGIGVGRLIPTR